MTGTEELELKARVTDAPALEQRLRGAGAALRFRGTMSDRRYDDAAGALDARDEVLRLRTYQPDSGSAYGVLGWKGPVSVRDGYKRREEHETRVTDWEASLALLERLGYRVTLRIDRTIAEYALEDATIRIEWYPAMDILVEIEGEPDAIERAARATGIPREEFVPEALPHFVAAYERRTGRQARLAL